MSRLSIQQVRLKNFKSYEYASIDFGLGVTTICGSNGSGKSTLLEAIGFALFDSSHYSHTEMVRDGALSGEVTVTVRSGSDGRVYTVLRTCGERSQHQVQCAGDVIVHGKKETMAWLATHIGAAPSTDLAALFDHAIGVPQGAITQAFLGTAAQRKALFDPLIGVSLYEHSWKAMREVDAVFRERLHAAQLQIAENEPMAIRHAALTTQLQQMHGDIRSGSDALIHARAERDARARQFAQVKQLAEADNITHHQLETGQMRAIELHDALTGLRSDIEHTAQSVVHGAAYDREAGLYEQAQAAFAKLSVSLDQSAPIPDIAAMQQACMLSEAKLKLAVEQTAAVAAAAQTIEAMHDLASRWSDASSHSEQQASRLATMQRLARGYERSSKACDALEEQRLATQRALDELRDRTVVQREQARSILSHAEHRVAALQSMRHSETLMHWHEQQASLLASAICPVCGQAVAASDVLASRATLQDAANTEQWAWYSAWREWEEMPDAQFPDGQQESADNEQALQSTIVRMHSDVRYSRDELVVMHAELDVAQEAYRASVQARDLLAKHAPERREYQTASHLASMGDETRAHEQGMRNTHRQQQVVLAKWLPLFEERERASGSRNAAAETMHRYASQHQAWREAQEAQSLAAEQQERAVRLRHELMVCMRNIDAQSHALHYQSLLAARTALQDSEDAHTAAQLDVVAQDERMQWMVKASDETQRDADSLVHSVSALHESQKTLQQTTMAKQQADAVRAIIRTMGPLIAQSVVQQISDAAHRLCCDMLEDSSVQLQWDETYAITMRQGGNRRQLQQMSGGEQIVAALSVRLALLQHISNIGIVCFDEPTIHLDTERRRQLAAHIKRIQGFEQILVISHDDSFEIATDNIIRIEKHDGKSIVFSDSLI